MVTDCGDESSDGSGGMTSIAPPIPVFPPKGGHDRTSPEVAAPGAAGYDLASEVDGFDHATRA